MADHNRNCPSSDPTGIFLALFLIFAALVLLALLTRAAPAHWSAQLAQEWGTIDPAWLPWFRGVRSPHGVPCCSVADGHRTTHERRPIGDPMLESGYWVQIEGAWLPVPPEAVVRGSKNPTGDSVVWFVHQTSPQARIFIRCFVAAVEG